jgi:hypothetical protein
MTRRLLLLLCLLIPATSFGIMGSLEGFATLDVVAGTDDVAMATVAHSGARATLFAYDTKTKRVMWRRRLRRNYARVSLAGDEFFMVDADILSANELATGKQIWAFDLTRVKRRPWRKEKVAALARRIEKLQKTLDDRKDLSNEEALNLRARMAESRLDMEVLKRKQAILDELENDLGKSFGVGFQYGRPLCSGSHIVVFRAMVSDLPCQARGIFSDWVAVDRATGKSVSTEECEWLRKAGDTIIFESPARDQDKRLCTIRDGNVTDITKKITGGIHGWYVDSFYAMATIQTSVGNTCMFGFSRTGLAGKTDVAVFRATDATVRFIQPDHKKAKGTNVEWVLLPDHVLRFSRHHWDGRPDTVLWIESYDLDGKLLKAREITRKSDKNQSYRCLDFAGTTPRGDVLVMDYTYSSRQTADDDVECSGTLAPSRVDLLVMGIPDLAIKRTVGLSTNGCTFHDVYARRQSDVVYQVLGNVEWSRMRKDVHPHELILRAVDVYSGKELWRHVEKVEVKKVADSGNQRGR